MYFESLRILSLYVLYEFQPISLPVFPSRIDLKLHNISVTSKMVKKVIMNLDLSKASGPDCISVLFLHTSRTLE